MKANPNQQNLQVNNNSKKNTDDTGEDCCEPEEIDECEVELLQNYKDIDVTRELNINTYSSVTHVKFYIELN